MMTTWVPKTQSFEYHKTAQFHNAGLALGICTLEGSPEKSIPVRPHPAYTTRNKIVPNPSQIDLDTESQGRGTETVTKQ